MTDPIGKILGDEWEHPKGKGNCFSCGKKGKQRFTGGGESVLCTKCWKEAQANAPAGVRY